MPRLGRSAVPPAAAAAPGSDRRLGFRLPPPAAFLLLVAAAGASTSSDDRAVDICVGKLLDRSMGMERGVETRGEIRFVCFNIITE